MCMIEDDILSVGLGTIRDFVVCNVPRCEPRSWISNLADFVRIVVSPRVEIFLVPEFSVLVAIEAPFSNLITPAFQAASADFAAEGHPLHCIFSVWQQASFILLCE